MTKLQGETGKPAAKDTPVTKILAEFVSHFDSNSLPPEVRHQVARGLVNWAGCAIGGSRHAAVTNALAAFGPFMGIGQSSVLGRSERVDALHAALFNGISSHVLDFDDTHHATLVHPSGPVLSAMLALAQFHKIDGPTFVESIALGIEVECRIALGVCPAHYDIGWHVTSTVGGFGAAAAVGRALKLNAKQMAWAFGIAATQASGLREVFGTMCKSLHPGRAAQSGLSAALMARAGFTSSERIIEAPRGFARVMSTQPHLNDTIEGLGEKWVVMDNAFKPYACGLVIHPIIDGCIALHSKQLFKPQDITSLHLRVNPLVVELTGKPQPTTGLEGKFSVYHSAAIVSLTGFSSSKHYSDIAVQGEEVTALRQKVSVEVDASIRVDEAYITVTLNDGTVHRHHVDHALGSLERPMSDENLNQKFTDLVSDILPATQVLKGLEQCWQVNSLPDAGVLGTLLSTG
ncbi:MmgE/PrpD family protein [Zwartia sp.]|uniref:MmgE/PrpD family protein n=1 Tax=Zwartia sp. TaxID=2978004 RepID=UPI0027193BB1|nr:MmgE/PrpD family protein [Zwartia sp.]MDO9025659.1 MmgE/PrpD family protein [Zwartia sp.]